MPISPARRRIILTLVVTALASSTPDARADAQQVRDSTQHRDSAVTLAPVDVRASIAPTAGVAIGSAVPARISILTGTQIDAWETRTIADVLGAQAGVSLYDDLGTPYKLNLSTRGFNVGPTVGLPPGVSVFLDGIRQNEPDAQEVNFDLLPMEHVERVELLSGTASLLGPNSLGGAVNLITRRGSGPASGELELSAGSFGAASLEASVAGTHASAWDYYASLGSDRERGWREGTGARSYDGFANLGHRGATRGVNLQLYTARSRAETAGSLPESIFGVSPRTNFTAGDFEDLRATQLALSGYAPVATGRGTFSVYLRRSDAERFNVNQAPDDNVRNRSTMGSIGSNADWRRSVTLGGTVAELRVGVDGAAHRVHVRLFTEPSTLGSSARDDSLTTSVRSPSWDVAGYMIGDMRLGRVTLSGGARYDYVRVPFSNELAGSDTTSTFTHLSPRAGASVDLGGGAMAYASIGQSFRAPAILELGCADPDATCPLPFALGDDPPLRPVRATTYEVGGRWLRGIAQLDASLYRTDVRDEIFFIASEKALYSGYFTNLARTQREGAELAAQLSLLGDRITAYASYAYTCATFQSAAELFSIRSDADFATSALAGANDVVAGDRLPLTPAHQAKSGALARLPRGVEVGADVRWFGRQWLRGDEANATRPLAAYTTANARLALEVREWEFALLAENLFDSHAATFGTFNENRRTGALERFLTPMNARALKLVVRLAWGRA
jgi:outer membrane receptor protein involved in Fe transport